MNVSFSPNVCFQATNASNAVSSNLIDDLKKNSEVPKPQTSQDKISINKDFISDLKYNAEKSAFGTIVEGYVNGKPSSFKLVSNNEDEYWLEGQINNRYVILHGNDKSYDGKYEDTDFNLTVDYNKPSKLSSFYNQIIRGKIFMPDYFIVKGDVGGKEVDITLPNAKIPDDPQIRDLLTLILANNGFKAQTVNGEIKSLKFSQSAINDIKKKTEKRDKLINNDIKPIVIQGISSATGLIVGSIVSALLLKFGLRK